MSDKTGRQPDGAEKLLRDIRRATRRHFSAEERIGIVLEGLRGEDSSAVLCRREGIAIARDIAENAPLSISVQKEQLRMLEGAHPMSPRRFERVQGLRRVVYDSEDYAEGIRSFPRSASRISPEAKA